MQFPKQGIIEKLLHFIQNIKEDLISNDQF